MPNNNINKLRAGGERITPLRVALIQILSNNKTPQTPKELLEKLKLAGLNANKTTIYRQLETLQRFGLIEEIRFADRTKRYEIISEDGHHHHLVCQKCHRIEDVSLPTDLEKQEKTILAKTGFKVLQHSLEFFGKCKNCQKKTK